MPEACPVHRPRKPHLTPHYRCVQDHFRTLEQVWPERFEKHFGFWRPYSKRPCSDTRPAATYTQVSPVLSAWFAAATFCWPPGAQDAPGQRQDRRGIRPHDGRPTPPGAGCANGNRQTPSPPCWSRPVFLMAWLLTTSSAPIPRPWLPLRAQASGRGSKRTLSRSSSLRDSVS